MFFQGILSCYNVYHTGKTTHSSATTARCAKSKTQICHNVNETFDRKTNNLWQKYIFCYNVRLIRVNFVIEITCAESFQAGWRWRLLTWKRHTVLRICISVTMWPEKNCHNIRFICITRVSLVTFRRGTRKNKEFRLFWFRFLSIKNFSSSRQKSRSDALSSHYTD
jgi:hypothetical protein